MSIESRSRQYGVVFDHWAIQDMLGSGSGGKTAVFRLAHTDAAGMYSALKVVNLIEGQGSFSQKTEWQQRDYLAALDDCKKTAAGEVWLMNDFQGNTNIVDYLDHKFINWQEADSFGCDMLVRMELLQDLRGIINKGTGFSQQEVLKIGIHIAQALVLCHGKDILHRDIKPENIFINRNGDYKLGDFGISRIISTTSMSMASTNIGTPVYMAPEQSSGQYDQRVDIYSLGLVLYELSNRMRLPFAASSYVRMEDIQKRLAGIPMNGPCDASPALAAVIMKACAHDPKYRYQTAQEFLNALRAVEQTSAPQASVYATPPQPYVTPAAQLAQPYATAPAYVTPAPQQPQPYVTPAAQPAQPYATAPAYVTPAPQRPQPYTTPTVQPAQTYATPAPQPYGTAPGYTTPVPQSGAPQQTAAPNTAPARTPVSPYYSAVSQSPAPKKKRSNAGLIIFLVLLLVVGLIVGISLLGEDSGSSGSRDKSSSDRDSSHDQDSSTVEEYTPSSRNETVRYYLTGMEIDGVVYSAEEAGSNGSYVDLCSDGTGTFFVVQADGSTLVCDLKYEGDEIIEYIDGKKTGDYTFTKKGKRLTIIEDEASLYIEMYFVAE